MTSSFKDRNLTAVRQSRTRVQEARLMSNSDDEADLDLYSCMTSSWRERGVTDVLRESLGKKLGWLVFETAKYGIH